jgi:hypothetical protein
MGECGVGLRSEPAAVDPGWILSTTFTFTGKYNTTAGSPNFTLTHLLYRRNLLK